MQVACSLEADQRSVRAGCAEQNAKVDRRAAGREKSLQHGGEAWKLGASRKRQPSVVSLAWLLQLSHWGVENYRGRQMESENGLWTVIN